MPTYEWRCRACGSTFDVKRQMSESADPAVCPAGHADTVRLLSTVALAASPGAPAGPRAASGPDGGCCGGACCS